MIFQEMFPILYSLDKHNKTRQWTISVVNKETYSQIITQFGTRDGKIIETIQDVLHGKNLGKKNQTTHYQQAISEAQSKWNKKKDKELYTIEIPSAPSTPSTPSTPLISPMLAQDYKKHASKLVYPCYIQPKLDGYRCIYNKGVLMSRQHKEFTIVKQYHTQLITELNKLPNDIIFDGELYVHCEISFEALGVLRKQKNMSPQDIIHLQKVEYHIYDIVDPYLSFEQRLTVLQKIPFHHFKFIKPVNTIEVHDKDSLETHHISFVNEHHYEGTMVRNKRGKYIGYRSTDLLKYKNFEDNEFEIVDFTFELNNNEHLIVWKVAVNKEKDIICDIRPQGTKEERIELYKRGKEFIGKKLWTKFFGYTEKGSLRFPSTQRNTYKSYIRNIIE